MSKLSYFNANSEAKTEYTKQLQLLLTPRIYEGIDAIYNDSMKASSEGGDRMRIFQNFLKSIPKWNQEIINDETSRIIEDSKCNYMDKLLNAIFISHTNSLTLKKNKKNTNLNIDVPKLGYFIHKCYIETAREFYKNPYLLDKSIRSPKDRQANLRESLGIVNESINTTIRNLLPMENILDIYLQETTEESDQEETFEASTTSVSQHELQSITNELVMNENTNHQNGGELNNTIEIKNEEDKSDLDQEPIVEEMNGGESENKVQSETDGENDGENDGESKMDGVDSENDGENKMDGGYSENGDEGENEEMNGGDLSQEKNIVINIDPQEGDEEDNEEMRKVLELLY